MECIIMPAVRRGTESCLIEINTDDRYCFPRGFFILRSIPIKEIIDPYGMDGEKPSGSS